MKYLTNTRPDICFVVNTLSQLLIDMVSVHLVVAKHVLRYLKGIVEYGLKYDMIRRLTCTIMLAWIG